MTEPVLHDYQLLARDFLRANPAAGLFLDMGLGKTISTLSALEPRHLPVLVVAPKRVAENVWDAEVEKWGLSYRVAVAKGDPDVRARQLLSGADIVVLGRDNLRDVAKTFRGAKRPLPFRTVIIDELSGYKTRSSVRWKTLRKIITQPSVQNVWGLTGTPAPNGMMDLWAQLCLLDGGQRLGRNITSYRHAYFTPGDRLPNGIVTRWDIRPEAPDQIMKKIEDICLAMSGEGRIPLPPVAFNDIEVDLPPRVLSVYKELERELVVDLRDIFGGAVHSAESAATLTTRLSQVASGFIFEDPVYEFNPMDDEDEGRQVNAGAFTWLHDETINAVREIVESVQTPILMAYRYIPEREALLAAFDGDIHTVDEPDLQRRWNAGEFPILLAHPASVGHGLNLQYGGHTIVWASPTWELELWDQFNKRLARQGQTEPVVIHSIMRRGTIDKRIRTRLASKSATQVKLLDYLESPV